MEYVKRECVGRFQIVAHLDSGGMADVYLARRTDQPEALGVIKILHPKYQHEAEIVAMFRDEARIMTQLNHPNVVRVFEHGDAGDRPYIAMEYLAGDHLGLLARRARRLDRPLTISLVTRIFLQVANALAYLHESKGADGQPLGIVHRDISPQNIFVTYDGRIKILDFGIALSVDRSVSTRTGMLKGKVRYMSPEQVNALPLDHRSDLFSLGIVFWEMLTGRKLFDADSEFQMMKRICEEPVPAPSAFRDDVSPGLEVVVMGLLTRPVDKRIQSAAEVRALLMEVLRGELAGSPPDEIVRTAEGLLGERKRWKDKAIASLHAEQEMQAYLFGDLDQQEDLSEPGVEEYPVEEKPVEASPPPALQPTRVPIESPAPRPPVEAGSAPARSGRAGPHALIVPLILALLILGAGSGTLLLLWPDKNSDPSGAIAPAQVYPADPPPADGQPPGAVPGEAPGPDEDDAPGAAAAEGDAPDQAAAEGDAPDQAAAEGDAPDQAADEGDAPDQADDEGDAPDQADEEGDAPDQADEEGDAPGEAADEGDDPGEAAQADAPQDQASGADAAKRIAPPDQDPAAPLTAPDERPAKEEKMGFLQIKTSPVTEVFVDERFAGKTPIIDMELPPGTHKVVMINRNHDIRKAVTVKIKKGEVSAMHYFF